MIVARKLMRVWTHAETVRVGASSEGLIPKDQKSPLNVDAGFLFF